MSQAIQSIWVHITSGRGPDECALAVRKLFEHLSKDAHAHHLAIEIIDSTTGKMPDTYDSILLNVSGHRAARFIEPYVGSVKWISKSPYRPKHKRKNWFVGVGIMAPLSALETHVQPADITWKAVKASGPGGQHVNTTDSAVQATHHPSGIQVRSSKGRSQHANKKFAVEKIVMALQAREKTAQANSAQSQWATHSDLERGNPVKTFVGKAFRER